MDLNQNAAYFPCVTQHAENYDNFGDTALSLDGLTQRGSNSYKFGSTQSSFGLFPPPPTDDGCRLVLGLGPTTEARPNKGGSSSNGDSILQLGLSGAATGSFFAPTIDFSGSTHNEMNTSHQPFNEKRLTYPIVDEGSTSAKRSGGYMPSLLLAPRMDINGSLPPIHDLPDPAATLQGSEYSQMSFDTSTTTTSSTGLLSELSAAVTSSDQRPQMAKRCRFPGCTKGARGASGLCIGHGGGQRCQKPGCNKGSESRTAFCKAHGGGRRCLHLGCTKSAEGKTEYCIAHGGGRRCGHPGGCTKAARGKSGLCIRHGGGKRCRVDGCSRSAEGQVGLCISHGGGRRCQVPGCSKGAQGSTMFCKAHGGGKRCVFVGCTKGAEGSTPLCKGHGGGKRCMFDGGGICPKSVHGGTSFCVAHGGGKRCAVAGCTKSARGRTDCCVKHGGGKRCKIEGCAKSAQGSTDFCKAHGGGKRCSWGGGGKCEKFARGKSGLCAAHTSLVHGKEGKKTGGGGGGGGMIGPGLFHGLVNSAASSASVVSSDHTDAVQRPAKRQQLIPPMVLVPLSMKSSSSRSEMTAEVRGVGAGGGGGNGGFEFGVPEGRVHGGGLMSLLGGNLTNAM